MTRCANLYLHQFTVGVRTTSHTKGLAGVAGPALYHTVGKQTSEKFDNWGALEHTTTSQGVCQASSYTLIRVSLPAQAALAKSAPKERGLKLRATRYAHPIGVLTISAPEERGLKRQALHHDAELVEHLAMSAPKGRGLKHGTELNSG